MGDASPKSKLARAMAGAAQPETQPTPLQRAISASRPFVPWRIPRLDLDVAVTLVGHADAERIEGEVFARMRELKLDLNTTTESTYEAARACRHLAIAVVDPASHAPIGSVSDWEGMDEDLIGQCWRFQTGVRSAYDPLSQPLTDEQIEAVDIIIKKKEPMLLRLFGTHILASYLLAMADRASISPTPKSSTTE